VEFLTALENGAMLLIPHTSLSWDEQRSITGQILLLCTNCKIIIVSTNLHDAENILLFQCEV